MKKISLLVLALGLGILVAVSPSRGETEPPSLVGTWRLVSFEDHPDQGPVEFPFGSSPKGLLIYDATGHMSIQIMKTPHPKVASGDEGNATPEEKIALFDSYVAYFGTYEVDAARGVVIHHVEGDFSDTYIGIAQERPYELAGDRLVLKPRWKAEGKQWLGIRVFERVSSPNSSPSAAEEIGRVIRERLDAYGKRDAAGWARLVADDCLCGTSTKAALRHEIETRLPGLENWYGEILGLEVRFHGDTAVARYRTTEYSELGGQRIGYPVSRTEAHRKKDGSWQVIGSAETALPLDPAVARVDPKIYDAYVGRYEYAPGIVDTVTREGDRLLVQATGQPKEEVFPENEITYFGKGQDWRLIFVKDEQGRVTAVRFRQHGQDIVARRIP